MKLSGNTVLITVAVAQGLIAGRRQKAPDETTNAKGMA